MCVKGDCRQCAQDTDCGRDSTCVNGACQIDTGDHGTGGSSGSSN
jgi:hypothetical protein